MWRKKGTANDPKHTTSSVKHGGGSVIGDSPKQATVEIGCIKGWEKHFKG